jgi:RNA polymerase sigma-70 factor (ECF subfamily)
MVEKKKDTSGKADLMPDEPSDRDLMQNVLAGDMKAFECLVDRYKIKLFNLIFRMLGNREESEDILQETFLRVYRERESYDFSYQFSTWIYTIALNLTKNELRKRKRYTFLGIDLFANRREFAVETSGNPTSISLFLEKTIDSLPRKYKSAFLMRDINQLSYERISEVLGIPLGTVKSRVNRARGILRKKLKPKMEEYYELSKSQAIPLELS